MDSRSQSPVRGSARPRTRSRSPVASRSRSRSANGRNRSLSRSRSPIRNRNRSYSRSRSRSFSRSRSRSFSRSRSRSWSRGRDAPVAKSTKIVVERLTKNINEDHLYEIFGQFGRIKDLDLPVNRSSGTNRGTAYILFDREADAEDAITHLHEAQVDGATIHVSIVLPRRKLSPPPPTASRGANIDPRVPFSGPPRGGGGGGRRRRGGGGPPMSPGSRFGPRANVYRPRSSRSPSPRGDGFPGGGSYRSRSRGSYSSRSRSPPPTRGGPGGRRSRSRSFDSLRDRNTSPMKQ